MGTGLWLLRRTKRNSHKASLAKILYLALQVVESILNKPFVFDQMEYFVVEPIKGLFTVFLVSDCLCMLLHVVEKFSIMT